MRSFSQGSGPSPATISNIVIQPPMSMPRVTAAVLQPQMSMITGQPTFSRVILQQQAVVGVAGGGSVQTERRSNLTTSMQPLKSVIQTVNGHHSNNGTATHNGNPESTFLGKSRPPITSAVLSSNGRSTGATTTMQISQAPTTYLSQAKVAGGQIQLMGSNTGQVLASRVSFGVLLFEAFL